MHTSWKFASALLAFFAPIFSIACAVPVDARDGNDEAVNEVEGIPAGENGALGHEAPDEASVATSGGRCSGATCTAHGCSANGCTGAIGHEALPSNGRGCGCSSTSCTGRGCDAHGCDGSECGCAGHNASTPGTASSR